ncbi:SpoIIIAH-like family protein [Bacillus carboniphilus]|uniref:SpoIIIAH-like family protein n=1 Tax=Bacillus carboniphilus TaxID=86663 RepID=A0ABY9JWW9_9BACI|nr:SpoIIIAH-like family protein [Bacillus carboniphilus]WLR43887.1 SpoIIIAH-like family protein [Bacillus carboniphilus]
MLKKQTVWLLTMLSLVIVLSIYYINTPKDMATPEQINQEVAKGTDLVKDDQEKSEEDKDVMGEGKEQLEDGTIISSESSESVFDSLRLELEEQRSEREEHLEAVVASAEATTQEKNKAYDELRELNDLSSKEKVLETLIKSQGYDEALVRASEGNVRITVKSNELSKSDANKIIQLVKTEIKDIQDVAVQYEVEK